jgi:hypothetical protein
VTGLTNRRTTRGALTRLVHGVRSGESRVLIVRRDLCGGKTPPPDHWAGLASGSRCRMEWAAGMQSRTELAFALLYQLRPSIPDHLERIPAPQCAVLWTALGVAVRPPSGRFSVGLGVSRPPADVAGERPLIGAIADEPRWTGLPQDAK